MKYRNSKQVGWLLCGLTAFVFGAVPAVAVENTVESATSQEISVQKVNVEGPSGEVVPVDYVSINVDGGSLIQVLNAFALQTGRNIVVGPNVVVSNGVTLHLNNVRWDEALDVILKPYGFGYQKVGDTVVVSKLSEMALLTAVEPLETKVFTLRFLDAGDAQEIIKGQLSARGTSSVSMSRGMKGWKNNPGGGSRSGNSGSVLGQLERVEDKPGKEERVRSKTLIVTDVPSRLARIHDVLDSLDIMQQQIQVEARFMEVNQALLKDVGLDFTSVKLDAKVRNIGQARTAGNTITRPSDDNPVKAYPSYDLLQSFNYLTWDAGVANAQATINFLQEDEDTKVLSAPRILTLNNQEATILVGQKYPIVKTDLGSGTSTIATTTLDYYENIGIQLNVVPQICADGYINMIVRPVVSSIVELAPGENGIPSPYPIINIREAETQIMLKDSETIVIGGLLEDRKSKGDRRIPFLGDIPVIGRFFKLRGTTDNQTIDLLIFLTANIITPDNQHAVIGERGKSGMKKPVAAAVPAAVTEVPPAAVSELPVTVKTPADPASVEEIYKEMQK